MNTKAVAAAEKKAGAQAQKDKQQNVLKEAQEAAEWKKGSNARKAGKDEKEREKEAEKLRGAAAKKDALAAEEEELEGVKTVVKKKKKKKSDVPEYMLALQDTKKMTKWERQQAAKKKEKEQRRKMQEEKEANAATQPRKQRDDLLVENLNHMSMDVGSATGIDGAIDALSQETKAVKHPERRLKAAYAAYEEVQMQILREEQPNLKRSQYKDRIFEMWKRSPENPLNQAHLEYNEKKTI